MDESTQSQNAHVTCKGREKAIEFDVRRLIVEKRSIILEFKCRENAELKLDVVDELCVAPENGEDKVVVPPSTKLLYKAHILLSKLEILLTLSVG